MSKNKTVEIIGKVALTKLGSEIEELMIAGMTYDEIIDMIDLVSHNLKRIAKNNSPVSNYFDY